MRQQVKFVKTEQFACKSPLTVAAAGQPRASSPREEPEHEVREPLLLHCNVFACDLLTFSAAGLRC